MRYVVVRASTYQELETRVNHLTTNGWTPHGPLVVERGEKIQPLIRDDK